MDTKIPLKIESLLYSLGINAFFRLSNGILYTKLTDAFLESVDEVSADMISDNNYDLIISSTMSDGNFMIICRIDSDNIDTEIEIPLSDFCDTEMAEIYRNFNLLSASTPVVTTQDPSKIIIRKKSPDGMLDINHSSSKLNCSQIYLKSKIPCTDYSYQEINGIKEINEYYWSEDFIDRLCKIKSNGVKTEDVQYMADECCHGDCKWAEEILISLCRPTSKPKDYSSLPQSLTTKNKKTDTKNHRPALNKKPRR